MPTKNMVIRSTKPNTIMAGARYVNFAPEHNGQLVTVENAQRFTSSQVAAVIEQKIEQGEWQRGDYRRIFLVDARTLRDR
jgi:hypothetical protein